MRAGIEITVTPEDRRRLEAIVADRNTPQKHAAHARVVLATAEGCGTMEVTRQLGFERFTIAGHDRGARSHYGQHFKPLDAWADDLNPGEQRPDLILAAFTAFFAGREPEPPAE